MKYSDDFILFLINAILFMFAIAILIDIIFDNSDKGNKECCKCCCEYYKEVIVK